MDFKQFSSRYFDFWQFYNPGRNFPPEIKNTARVYFDRLKEKNIPFAVFDEACRCVEDEFSELPFNFNIVAYTFDLYISKLNEANEREHQFYKSNIPLPTEGKPLPPDKAALFKKRKEDLLAKAEQWAKDNDYYIKKFANDFKNITERIYAKRISQPEKAEPGFCSACNNSGWVSVLRDGVDWAKRCVCPKGQRIKSGAIATSDECIDAAQRNDGTLILVPF